MAMDRTRRGFMKAATLASVAALVGRASAQDRPPLAVPPLIDAAAGVPVTLTAQPGETEFFPGQHSATAGYNGSFLGPTLRMRSGSEVPVHVRNRLPEATTVHWHGMLVPSEVDGGMHNEIPPGGEWKTQLPVRQPAATLWYHAHPHLRTGPQVYGGLAGMLLVTDAEEQGLGLPGRYGSDDLPVILQDRAFDRAGRMVYPRNHMAQMHGAHGDVMLVNGQREPQAAVPAGWVRLRVLNAANARVFDLAFEDGRAFHWIATDGGLLREPVRLHRLKLAPAQRAELLVDCSDGRSAVLANRVPGGRSVVRPGVRGFALDPLLHLAPRTGERGTGILPTRLADWTAPSAEQAVRRRRMTMTMGMAGMGMGGMHGGMHGRAGAMAMGMDGRAFDMHRIDQQVKLGDLEVWEVSSQPGMMMDMPHPFHIHGVHFEVLRRDGRAPLATDAGRRDTVLVDAPVELLVHFTQPAAAKAPFMYHCHILEHEDAGMMGQFTVA